MNSTLIKNGHVATGSQEYVADVLIEDGKIRTVGSLPNIQADIIIDAAGKLVLPGGIDPHTHFDLPHRGTVTSDDFRTGTIAAAVGGTTTIIDFPIQARGEDMRVSLERWFEKAEGKSVVDWGFHQIVTDLSDSLVSGIDESIKEGVTSFKLFMAYPEALMVDDGTIFKAMRRTSESGALVMVHAENGLVTDILTKEAIAAGRVAATFHGETRPSLTEGEATHRAIALAEMAGTPVYIVHLSAAEALSAVAEGRKRGVAAYAETCPHYLLLTDERIADPEEGAKFLVTPPLRARWHLEELWRGLRNGGPLQVVATDHASFRFKDQKQLGRDDFSVTPTGLPGVEWRIGLLFENGVAKGRISLSTFVQIISTNAAKIFGLYPKKGEIAPGSDGDILIFDPEREMTISATDMTTNCDYTPYEGVTVRGSADTVLLRGEIIVEGGKFVGREGQGQFLRRGASHPMA